jgi:hypothetical protein
MFPKMNQNYVGYGARGYISGVFTSGAASATSMINTCYSANKCKTVITASAGLYTPVTHNIPLNFIYIDSRSSNCLNVHMFSRMGIRI